MSRVGAALGALGVLFGAATIGCSAASPVGSTAAQAISFGSGTVDNAAIAEVTTMMLAGVPTSTILDPYNEEDPYAANAQAYAPTFTQRLSSFDAYDGNTDWQPDQATAWVNRVSGGNYLIIDTTMPCNFNAPQTYLEIERAQLTGQSHQTCGGRMPNEVAIDVTLNFLVRGPAASVNDPNALSEGVTQATTPAANTFPYLAEMN